MVIRGERIHASRVLARFYGGRMFQPAWSDEHGPKHQAHSLINAIRCAQREGLNPEDYHRLCIEEMLARTGDDGHGFLDPQGLADLDMLLTDAFLIYGSHLLSGKVDPETYKTRWNAENGEVDCVEVLCIALETDRVEEALMSLAPRYHGYIRLRQALVQYRDVAEEGGWPDIPEGDGTDAAMRQRRLIALLNRLVISGDLDHQDYENGGVSDAVLKDALKRFKKRHGLKPDGEITPDTLKALNVSAAERVRQIELNMERWRWLPHDLGDRYIIVNITDFRAGVFEEDRAVLEMRVVVGKDFRQTPVFSGTMEYIVFSPYWYIPKKIAVEDKLPLILQDPGYIEHQHIRVFITYNGGSCRIDPNTIDWQTVDPETFPYKLRQEPGPWNPLGRIKFIFPNKYAVYLHDTPSQELFEKAPRTFSSGCIRIEKPIELAEYLLQDDPRWTKKGILAAASSNVEQTVRLPCPVQVYIQYWTAWAREDLGVEFREDIYASDRLLDQALGGMPPGV
ncbi:MAG: L,D-transpeptidase family protein [bacterium]